MMLLLIAIIVMLCNKEQLLCLNIVMVFGFDVDADVDARDNYADAHRDDADAHSDHSDAVQ